MNTLQHRRHALYSALPFELAELIRSARRYADHMDDQHHANADAELSVLRAQADEVRKWEDRQLRVQDALGAPKGQPPKPPRAKRRRSSARHLRLVEDACAT